MCVLPPCFVLQNLLLTLIIYSVNDDKKNTIIKEVLEAPFVTRQGVGDTLNYSCHRNPVAVKVASLFRQTRSSPFSFRSEKVNRGEPVVCGCPLFPEKGELQHNKR